MINSVSDRIRSLIKSQDQTPQSQLYRSRDNSVESIRSGTNSRSINNNILPPKSPHKPRSQLHKSEVQQESNQIQPKQDYSDIIEQVKVKVMELVYPLLMELTKKVDHITQVTSSCPTKKQVDNTWKRIENDLQTQFDRVRAKIDSIQSKEIYEIQTEVSRLGNQYEVLSNQIEKVTMSSMTNILNTEVSNNTLNPHRYQKNSPEIFLNDKSREKQIMNQPQVKCKCEKLVQEILRSQNHLMMELKYVKHFQNYNQNSNSASSTSKNYNSRGR